MDKNLILKMLKTEPAKIEAKVNEYGKMELNVDGRSLELIAMAMSISQSICEQSHTSIDDFCEMLKYGSKLTDSDKINSKIFNKLLINLLIKSQL